MQFTLRRNHSEHWTMDTPHLHAGYELLLSLTDGGSFFLLDNLHPLRRGTLILLREGTLHRSVAVHGPYDRYVLHIPAGTLQSASTEQTDLTALFAENRCLQLEETEVRRLSALMDRCLTQTEDYGSDLLRDCDFLRLLVAVGRLLSQSGSVRVPAEGLSVPVRLAVDYITAHPTEDLSLDALAERCFVNKYHLCRLFKAETGFTPGEYIRRLRVLRAASLLREGETVQRASELAGFSNCGNFIRVFSQIMGISPGRYGKQQRKTQNL